MKVHLLLFFLILHSVTVKLLASDNDIIVKGTVTDASTSQALPFANVFMKNNVTTGTVTDLNGNFELTLHQAQLFDTLMISFVGYKDYQLVLAEIPNDDIQVELVPVTNTIEEAIVKTRSIISEEFTIAKIDQMDIYLNPLSKADPLLAVNGMASSTTLDESANISVRGSSPSETGIFFNEVPIYDAVRFAQLNGIGTFSVFNTSMIKKILVYPSNPPIEYGHATSGLISIYSTVELPKVNSNTIILSLASVGAYTSRKIKNKSAFTGFVNYQPSRIFTNLNQESLRDLKDFNSTDCGLYFVHKFNHRTSIKMFNYLNTEDFEYFLRHPSYTDNFKQRKKRDFLITNFSSGFPAGEFTVNAALNISKAKYKYGNTDIAFDNQDIYFAANYLHFFNKLTVKSGFSYDYRKMDFSGVLPEYYYAISDQHPVITVDIKDKLPIYEGYMYLKYKINTAWFVGTGIRKNFATADQDNYITYQVNLAYSINDIHTFKLSGGKYNKYAIADSEHKTTHFISNNQISFDYKFVKENIELTSAIFYKNSCVNSNEENIIGGEFFTRIYLTNKLEGQLSYTYIKAISNEEGICFPTEYSLNYYIRSSLKYNFLYNLSISTILLLRQGKYYVPVIESEYDDITETFRPIYDSPANSRRLPPYCRMDLSISKLFVTSENSSLIMFFNVNNLLNRNNVQKINYNANYSIPFEEYYSKRTFYFGVVFNF